MKKFLVKNAKGIISKMKPEVRTTLVLDPTDIQFSEAQLNTILNKIVDIN